MILSNIAKLTKGNNLEVGSYVAYLPKKDYTKTISKFDLDKFEDTRFLELGKIVDVNDDSISIKLDLGNKERILKKDSWKYFWEVTDKNMISKMFSNINGGNIMKITKKYLITFAESLTTALEEVAEKVSAIEDIINGEAEVSDYVDNDEEDEVIEEDYDMSEEDEEENAEDDDEVEVEVEEEESSEEENFSKRYSNVKNFLTL